MKTQLLVCAFFFLVSLENNFAQQRITGPEEKQLTLMTPLCQNEKYIWAESNLGLLRINMTTGNIWSFTKSNSILPSNDITCVVSLKNGQTYIATTKGMVLWDNYSMLLLNIENTSLPENHVIDMWLDDNENLIIRTKNNGTYRGTGADIKVYKLKKVEDALESVETAEKNK